MEIPKTIKEFLDSPAMAGQPVTYSEFQHDGGVKCQLDYAPEGNQGYVASLTTDRKPDEDDHADLIEHFTEVSKRMKYSLGLTWV